MTPSFLLKPKAARPSELLNVDNIRIASPCPARWEEMAGDCRVRHCAECNLNVYNFSAMTQHEIRELVTASRGGRLCVRFYRRADGTVLTRDCPRGLRAAARQVSRWTAAALSALMSVSLAQAKAKTKASPKPQPQACHVNKDNLKAGSILLLVTDPDGAVIPQAQAELLDASGEVAFRGATGPSGQLDLVDVAPGHYVLTVAVPGFKVHSAALNLGKNQMLQIQLKLAVAGAATTVEVKAEAMEVTVGALVSTQEAGDMPASLPVRAPIAPLRP